MTEPCPACGAVPNVCYICDDCGAPLPVVSSVNYFQLLSVPFKFSIDPSQIESGYETIMESLHPDFFEQKDGIQKSRSINWSLLAKQAHETLLHPQKRAEYIYRLAFPNADATSFNPPQTFILEMFELRDSLADKPDDDLIKQTRLNCEQFELRCVDVFDALTVPDTAGHYLNDAGSLLNEFKFWINIRNTLNDLTQPND